MLKVSYNKEIGEGGYVYNQKIKVNKEIVEKFNKYINQVRTKINDNYKEKHSIDYKNLKVLSYLEPLYKNYNYLSLTQLHYFMYYLSYYEHKSIKRIFNNRNTIIEII